MKEDAIRAIIFDFDGLIMDTETATYEAWRQIYAEHGQPLAMETWAQCIGSDFGNYDPMRELEELIGRQLEWEPIHQERRERVMAILSTYGALPGVRDRLQEAEALGLPCSVASSSPRWWVEHWLKHLGLREAFQNVTTLDDTGKVKPDPSLFLHAAEKLTRQPAESVVLEDSLNGLRAAHAAGMRCVVVPCEMTQHLSFEGAWRQHASLSELSFRDLAPS
jgi:putative hydrolase of the HAD superfamily